MAPRKRNHDQEPPDPDAVYGRPLPSDEGAEKLCLGSILMGQEQALGLDPEDFSLEGHKRVFAAIKGLVESGTATDRVTVAGELMRRKHLESAGGLTFLVSLTEDLPELSNVAAYVEIVREKARLRKIIFAAQRTLDRALTEQGTAEEIAGSVGDILGSINAHKVQDAGKSPEQIVTDYGISAFMDPSTRQTGLMTGFAKFDEATNGLHAGELTILAARPSVGKTMCALNIAAHVARKHGPVAFFSLEMSGVSLLTRLVCAEGRIDQHKYRAGYLNSEERRKLQMALDGVCNMPLVIFDQPGLGLPEFARLLRRLVKNGVVLTILDYIGLMDIGRTENRTVGVGNISRGLKILTKELNHPILALSQLKRPDNAARTQPPILSDLRDSGCLHGDSLVTLADSGLRVPIRSLVGKSGFNVWSFDSNVKAAKCSKVFTTGIKPMFEMETVSGHKIKATANHRFLATSGWKRLDELKIGDTIACYGEIPEPPNTKDLPDNELFFLGHMLGNGCILPSHAAQYTTQHEDVAHAVKDSAIQLFGSDVNPRVEYANPRDQGGWYQVFMSSTRKHTHGVRSAVSEWAEGHGLFGKRARQKSLPACIYAHSNAGIAKLLSGLWETDGTIGVSNRKINVAYSSSSHVLAEGIQYLLSRLGITSSLSKAYKGNRILSVTGGRYSCSKLLRLILPVGEHQRSTVSATLDYISSLRGHSTTTKIVKGGVTREQIRHIETCGEYEAFDMTVPSTQNMEVSCFVTHNSLEQDSDNVAFIWREELVKPTRDELKGLAEIRIQKQRNGPLAVCPLRFIGHLGRFENRADDITYPEEKTGSAPPAEDDAGW